MNSTNISKLVNLSKFIIIIINHFKDQENSDRNNNQNKKITSLK